MIKKIKVVDNNYIIDLLIDDIGIKIKTNTTNPVANKCFEAYKQEDIILANKIISNRKDIINHIKEIKTQLKPIYNLLEEKGINLNKELLKIQQKPMFLKDKQKKLAYFRTYILQVAKEKIINKINFQIKKNNIEDFIIKLEDNKKNIGIFFSHEILMHGKQNKIDMYIKELDIKEQLNNLLNSSNVKFIFHINQIKYILQKKILEIEHIINLYEEYDNINQLEIYDKYLHFDNDGKIIDVNKLIRYLHNSFEEYKTLNEDIKKIKQAESFSKINAYHQFFETALSMNRKLYFYVGETNSGKTYNALQKLKEAESGIYLAPLRLMALEKYEELNNDGFITSLLTGEERIINENSKFISSTIEMANFNKPIDVAIIDEVQKIKESDRGWAWTSAVIGIPAKEIYMTGSKDALPYIQKIAKIMKMELEIVHFERKNKLEVLERAVDIMHLKKHDALITFSRKEVLDTKRMLMTKNGNLRISVIYGSLSPEIRRKEAERFRKGDTDILIATDAIGMGLNLPIHRVIFMKTQKFDGDKIRDLNESEIKQISGRAGRYGFSEKGYVGYLFDEDYFMIKKAIETPLEIEDNVKLFVSPTFEHIKSIGKIINTDSLYQIYTLFVEKMLKNHDYYIPANLNDQIELALIADKFDLTLYEKFIFSCTPINLDDDILNEFFYKALERYEKNKQMKIYREYDLEMNDINDFNMLKAETHVKLLTAYQWLNFKYPHIFNDINTCNDLKLDYNSFIEKCLLNKKIKFK